MSPSGSTAPMIPTNILGGLSWSKVGALNAPAPASPAAHLTTTSTESNASATVHEGLLVPESLRRGGMTDSMISSAATSDTSHSQTLPIIPLLDSSSAPAAAGEGSQHAGNSQPISESSYDLLASTISSASHEGNGHEDQEQGQGQEPILDTSVLKIDASAADWVAEFHAAQLASQSQGRHASGSSPDSSSILLSGTQTSVSLPPTTASDASEYASENESGMAESGVVSFFILLLFLTVCVGSGHYYDFVLQISLHVQCLHAPLLHVGWQLRTLVSTHYCSHSALHTHTLVHTQINQLMLTKITPRIIDGGHALILILERGELRRSITCSISSRTRCSARSCR